MAVVLELHHAWLGSSGAKRALPQFCALVERPTPGGRPCRDRRGVGRAAKQVGDVGRGVRALIVGERPAQPIGETVALRQTDTEFGRQEVPQATGVECPRKPAASWVSNNRAGTAPHARVQHFEILLGGVHNRESRALEHGAQRTDVDRERIDQSQARRPRDLQRGPTRGKYVFSRWNSVSSA